MWVFYTLSVKKGCFMHVFSSNYVVYNVEGVKMSKMISIRWHRESLDNLSTKRKRFKAGLIFKTLEKKYAILFTTSLFNSRHRV
jgi:hypothetical protein